MALTAIFAATFGRGMVSAAATRYRRWKAERPIITAHPNWRGEHVADLYVKRIEAIGRASVWLFIAAISAAYLAF